MLFYFEIFILNITATNVFTSYLCATSGGRFREYAILIAAYTRHRHWYCIIIRGICVAKNIFLLLSYE